MVANGTNTTTADGTRTVTVLSYNDVQAAAAEDGDFLRLVELVVQFEDEDLNRLADGQGNAALEVYGTYTDARYTDARAYWDGSVVNSDLTVFASQGDSQGESTGNEGGNGN